MKLSEDKNFLKVRDFLLECQKIVSKFNFFSRKYLTFKEGVSAHCSIDGVARIAGKEGTEGFTLKVHILSSLGGLGGRIRNYLMSSSDEDKSS